jgi:hypothetical protein
VTAPTKTLSTKDRVKAYLQKASGGKPLGISNGQVADDIATPTNPGVVSTGIFMESSKQADEFRARLAGIGMKWFHECQNERTMQERQWYLNLAFFYGNQNVQFRSTQNGSFDLYTPTAPYYRVRMVVNQVRRIIRKEISRLTAQKPNAFVVPSSTEDQDMFAAQAGEQIWDSLWRKLKFNKVLRDAVFWQSVCGTGYVKAWWDPTKKDLDSSNEEQEVWGEICINSISPFYVFVPDLMCTEIEEQPYIIHAQVKTSAWVKQTFGIEADNYKLDSIDDNLQTIMNIEKNSKKKDQTTVLEVWVKPGYIPDLPKGGMFTIAANKVVQGMDEWPYDHEQYPLAKLDSVPTGKFYTSSIIEDLIPLQKELNRSRSQLIEAKNRTSKPQLVAEEGSVDAKKITTEPGQVIFYAVGRTPPQPLPLQNLPNYVTEEIDRLYTDMSDLSGQHEVSNGSTPPGVTAATAISFLQEQDESLIAGHYTSIEEAVEKTAGQCLTFVRMYWDQNRTVKFVGEDGAFDAQTFKNSDLRGNSDIRVEAGSALPTSRAAKQAFILDLMKMGYIDPQQGLEFLEIGAVNKIVDRIKVDKRQAARENLKMRVVTEDMMQQHAEEWTTAHPEVKKDADSGLALDVPLLVPVHTYDNHDIHIEEHNNYRKSQSFENADPITKMIFEEHVKQHEEAAANMMVHPLSGMDPSDPNAPNPDDEEMMMDQMQQDDSENGGTTGPVPMPQMSDEGSMQ